MSDATDLPVCVEPGCTNPRRYRDRAHTKLRLRCRSCEVRRYPENPEKAKARQRRKTHTRKAKTRYADFTPAQERDLRSKVKRCPLCRIRMVDEPYVPASKELDHMIPLNMGGTHTTGNVRIICRTCNIRRPKDGSDYAGPVTLWATHPGFMALPQRQPRAIPRCQCGAEKRNGRCWTCDPARIRPSRVADGQRAAAMRAEGHTWSVISQALGWLNTGACYQAAKAHGDPDVVAQWPERYARWNGPRPESNCA
jgi:hypothetical protein